VEISRERSEGDADRASASHFDAAQQPDSHRADLRRPNGTDEQHDMPRSLAAFIR